MVRTGERVGILKELLQSEGFHPANVIPSSPRLSDLKPETARRVVELYRTLGGNLAAPTLRPGPWDLAFDKGLVIEFDEEFHFNRYRLATLDFDSAFHQPWAEPYRRYCSDAETRCLAAGKWGKRWTNPSCEAMFGAAGAPGEFNDGGAPRWKQRALYDAVKDAYAYDSENIHLARLSIYDLVDGVELGTALESGRSVERAALLALVESRSS